MVMRLAWMAQRLQSSNKCTMKSSVAYAATTLRHSQPALENFLQLMLCKLLAAICQWHAGAHKPCERIAPS